MSQMASLYDRLGGIDAITAVVDSFVARAAANDRINRKFAQTDVPRLKKENIDQLCEATGGPCTYTGRNMWDSHAGMKVTDGEFDAFIEDLKATLDEFKVPRLSRKNCSICFCRCATKSLRSSRRRPGHRFRTVISLHPH